ncbi:phosphatidate cytidylyltransferase [Paenibacillus sp. y28]|uniref:phosphatidate cytidylyltransferase n=1 Tax=Paenibacillus sp. y28 TaxID=3129110 RepID=UPI003019722F
MKQRIITGVIAGAVFLALLYISNWTFAFMMSILAFIGYLEYVKLNRMSRKNPVVWIGAVVLLLMVIPWSLMGLGEVQFLSFVWLLLFLLLGWTVISKNRTTLDHAALLFAGVVYIGLGFSYMITTRTMEHGLFWTLFVFVCVWSSDSGAYFSGKAIGRTKLWPEISPNKTIEGSLGGVVWSVVAALLFAYFFPEIVSYGKAVVLGIVIAVVGQFGDLIQSAYKRIRDVKDTGTLLPGHGGVLDRCDSWMVVFPFLHLLFLLPGS